MSAPSFVHHAALPSFLRRGRIAAYLAVVLSGQVIYSAFEAFKGSLMLPLQESLGITQTQFGQLMTCIGLAMFLYVPAGWVNNRFRVRSIILAGLGWRLATYLVLFLLTPPFGLMITIAIAVRKTPCRPAPDADHRRQTCSARYCAYYWRHPLSGPGQVAKRD